MELDYQIKQIALLPETERDFVKGILMLDASNKVHVQPKHATPLADGIYLYTADVKTAVLEGYFVKYAGGVSNLRVGLLEIVIIIISIVFTGIVVLAYLECSFGRSQFGTAYHWRCPEKSY